MIFANVKIAMASIRGSRWRSILTMLGIIIGIVSVVTTVSLGEGVKKQVSQQINQLGSDLITIRPGKTVTRDENGNITGVNFIAGIGGSNLSENDLEIVKKTENMRVVSQLSIITGIARIDDREFSGGFIVATNESMPEILNQKVEYGSFFGAGDTHKHVAVIGRRVAEQLFQENVPIGKSLQIRGESFIVRGVFEDFPSNPLSPGSDFNGAIFIPYEIGKTLTGGNAQIYQILAKPDNPDIIKQTIRDLTERLKSAHGGEEDFTILKQDESLSITGNILNLMTSMIAGIAAISLLVGGIGIMNIMLVAVTERTREIGIRKAIGATNRQILGQFLIEAMVLSVWGGIIGIALSAVANFLIRIFTDLQPVITLQVVAVATLVSVSVGIIFGIAPALKAARKDPIDALRYE
jgi:ABC-type antimicrobial peptide transport system permease subunit